VVAHILLALLTWNWLSQLRILCIHRSDENWADRLAMILMRPLSSLWGSIVLGRLVRGYGTLTCLRQGWTTRQHGAELSLELPHSPPAAARQLAHEGTAV
jgi:hypothetical protein